MRKAPEHPSLRTLPYACSWSTPPQQLPHLEDLPGHCSLQGCSPNLCIDDLLHGRPCCYKHILALFSRSFKCLCVTPPGKSKVLTSNNYRFACFDSHEAELRLMYGKVKVKSLSSGGLFATPWTSPWNFPGENTGVGSLCLLQGIFPIQGLKPGLLHCRQILYQLSHKGSLRILEWVAYPFSRGPSQPRTQLG